MSKKKKCIKAIVKTSAIILGTTFVIMNVIARKKKADSIYASEVKQKNPFEGKSVIFVEDDSDKENADGVKGHLEVIGKTECLSGLNDKKNNRYSPFFYRICYSCTCYGDNCTCDKD